MIVIAFLLLLWYLNITSVNFYFFNTKEKIHDDLFIIRILYENFGFTDSDFSRFVKASNYFIEKPNEYNGTSVINDRWLIKGLEPFSVVHDYDLIMAECLNDYLKANKYYCECLRKVNANWFWVWIFIYCGLNIVSFFINLYKQTKKLIYGTTTKRSI